jgi:SAM-dependent methyltransferase
MELDQYLTNSQYNVQDGIYVFDDKKPANIKLNRINVLEELGKGFIWKNVYAHYYRFLFIMRWLRPRTILVDIGCGRGWLLNMIYRNKLDISYIGIDLSLASLKYASRTKYKCPRLLLQTNCVRPPLIQNFADYVVCLETIEHNDKENAENILRKCVDILKPGGLLFVSTPNRRNQTMVFPEDHVYEWELEEMSNYLKVIGLEIQQIFGCFGKKQEIIQSLDEIEKQLYLRLSNYFDWHVLSPFFSVLHPENSQGVIWLCKKAG